LEAKAPGGICSGVGGGEMVSARRHSMYVLVLSRRMQGREGREGWGRGRRSMPRRLQHPCPKHWLRSEMSRQTLMHRPTRQITRISPALVLCPIERVVIYHLLINTSLLATPPPPLPRRGALLATRCHLVNNIPTVVWRTSMNRNLMAAAVALLPRIDKLSGCLLRQMSRIHRSPFSPVQQYNQARTSPFLPRGRPGAKQCRGWSRSTCGAMAQQAKCCARVNGAPRSL
jgi:hypothetical protein